jgi:Spy/CpxP family protein refolding chaperone
MAFKKVTTSAAVIASLLAVNLSPLATAANAKDGWHGKSGHGYSRHYDGPRHDHGPRYRYAKRHRDHRGKDIAKGIAIGLGVLAVGAIISGHR